MESRIHRACSTQYFSWYIRGVEQTRSSRHPQQRRCRNMYSKFAVSSGYYVWPLMSASQYDLTVHRNNSFEKLNEFTTNVGTWNFIVYTRGTSLCWMSIIWRSVKSIGKNSLDLSRVDRTMTTSKLMEKTGEQSLWTTPIRQAHGDFPMRASNMNKLEWPLVRDIVSVVFGRKSNILY